MDIRIIALLVVVFGFALLTPLMTPKKSRSEHWR